MRSAVTRAAGSLALIGAATASAIDGTASQTCSCGFRDARHNQVFTDSIVVYFNETDSLPTDAFLIESYENPYEKGWNTLFRQGSSVENVNLRNASQSTKSLPESLELYCDVATKDHLVVGGGVRTARQDIFFGSFRVLIRSSKPRAGGSALSMMINYNETESIEMNQINQDDPANAWVSMISHGQFPDRDLGVEFTGIAGNGTDPWDWVEFRVDWSRNKINYYIADHLYRSVSRSEDDLLPQTPSALYLKHWSVGNFFSTQGPPKSRSLANIGWVRLFFNSSLMNDLEHSNFDGRCRMSDMCDMDDPTLRGFSSYSSDALSRWSQEQPDMQRLIAPTVISILSIAVFVCLLLNALLLRVPWQRFTVFQRMKERHPEEGGGLPTAEDSQSYGIGVSGSEAMTAGTTAVASTAISSAIDLRISTLSPPPSVPAYNRPDSEIQFADVSSTNASTEDVTHRDSEHPSMYSQEKSRKRSKFFEDIKDLSPVSVKEVWPEQKPEFTSGEQLKGVKTVASVSVKEVQSEQEAAEVVEEPVAKTRVDYLIGLVAIACLVVTAGNFNLTFIPATMESITFGHYSSENWTRKTVSPFLLNPNWICVFFVNSPRFLVATFLRTGSLKGIAQKTIERPFRLLIPVILIAALEYFLMDSGAINWLAYLPSITWTTWPFAAVPDTFGHFINQALELAYLVPNASPQITFNYCTGVLWAIPVLLQGCWTILLGAIMIYQIKTPWKRMGFYAWCILIHWYALSWGAYFYCGILLTDLDVTYQWKKWLYTHKHVYYPIILFCTLLAISSLGIDLISEWIDANCAAFEFGWHPDTETGLPIAQTPSAKYPPYFVPKLNGLSFSVFLQLVVEISPLVQKVFTFKPLTFVFPHLFTIYLIHGFVFWSLGSVICASLARTRLPYWANISIVAVCCYGAIVLIIPFLTPALVMLGKNLPRDIWVNAWQEPARRKPTMHPFNKELLEGRRGFEEDAETVASKDLEKGESSKGESLKIHIGHIGKDNNHKVYES